MPDKIDENRSTPSHTTVKFQNSGDKMKISQRKINKYVKHKGSEIRMALDFSNTVC